MNDRRGTLWAGAAVQTGLFAAVAWYPDHILSGFPATLFLLVAAAIPYLAACWAVSGSAGELDDRATWLLLFGAAVVVRLMLLPREVELSSDIFRYIWDGRMQLCGINPFLYAPSDPAVAQFRDSWHALIDDPDISTCYPPVAEFVFALASLIHHHPVTLKGILTVFDLAIGVMVWRMLRDRGLSGALVVWYLWNPVIPIETAYNGHVDVLAAFFVVLAFHLRGRSMRRGSKRLELAGWAALALGAMSKLYPALLIPFFFRGSTLRSWRKEWAGPAAFVAVCVVLIAPYAGAGVRLFVGLGAYVGFWEFNNSLFGILASVLPDGPVNRFFADTIVPWMTGHGVQRGVDQLYLLTKASALAIFVAVAAFAWRRPWPVERKLFWALAALILVSPVVFPWYLIMLAPWLAFRQSYAWALLSGLVLLSYWTLPVYESGGAWTETVWVRVVEYGALAFVALWEWWRAGEVPARQRKS